MLQRLPLKRSFLATVVASTILVMVPSVGLAHPFHVSFAEAEWNAETKRLEVALKLSPIDLENAVRRHSQKQVRLEQVEASEAFVQAYLKDHLRVRQEKKPISLKWVGYEVNPKDAWIYFEVPLPKGVEGIEIANTVLFGDVLGQVNYMSIRQGKQGATVQSNSKEKWRLVKLLDGPPKPVTKEALDPNHE